MKRSILLATLCIIAVCFMAGYVGALDAAAPPRHSAIMVEDSTTAGSLDELHRWFARESARLCKEHYDAGYRLVPLRIYPSHREVKADSSNWNVGVEYHLPLNTLNAFFTVYSAPIGENTKAWIRAFFGAGSEDVEGLDTKISGNWGINGEIGFYRDRLWLNPLIGVSYLWIDPKDFADGQGNYLYAGNRIFFTPSRTFSIDLRGGVAMWRDFDNGTETKKPEEWFFSAGITGHKDVDLTKISGSPVAPIEAGIYGNPSLETFNTKIMVPFRLYKGISFAPFGMYGFDIGSKDLDALYSIGGELRLFGDDVKSIRDEPQFNPYIGYQNFWLKYGSTSDVGIGYSFYFGARLYIFDRVAIDGNFGPVFWDDDYPVEEPDDWVGHVGLCAAFGKLREKPHLHGKIVAKEARWGSSVIDMNDFDPLMKNDIPRFNGETREYALEKHMPDGIPCVRPTGDLTDLKFFTIDLDLDISFDPFNTKADLLSGSKKKETEVFIAVLFNRNNAIVNDLSSKNTFFHFVDLENSQYLGYRWDANRSRQPEYRNLDTLGRHDGPAGPIYWGAFDEFVKPLTWLDGKKLLDFIEGRDIEREILRHMDEHFSTYDTSYQNAPTPEAKLAFVTKNYRIAYVKYPQSTIDKVYEFLPSWSIAAAVMVGIDSDRDGLFITADKANWMSGEKPGDAKSSARAVFDHNDHFFFSNHVMLEDILTGDVILDGFGECDTVLTDEHRKILNDEVIPRLVANPNEDVELIGYTDATPMNENCRKLYGNGNQKGLALARAKSVKKFLIYCGGIDTNRIKTFGAGIHKPKRPHTPSDRCVKVKFK